MQVTKRELEISVSVVRCGIIENDTNISSKCITFRAISHITSTDFLKAVFSFHNSLLL